MGSSIICRGAGPGLAAAALLLAGAAFALEQKSVVTAMTSALKAAGAEAVSVGGSDTSGADVTLSEVTIEAPVPRPLKAQIGSLVVAAPTARESGGLTSPLLSAMNGEITQGDNRFAWPSATVENVVIPSAAEISDRSAADLFTKISAENLTLRLSAKGKPTEVGGLTVTLGEVVDGIPRQVTVEMTDVKTDTTVVGRVPRLQRLMENLGYGALEMDVVANLSYEPDTGTIGIETVDVDIADFGKVRITGSASGLPLSRLQSEATARDLVAAARIDGLTVRFDNAGLVERGLDKQAELMGTTRADLQQQMSAAIPLLLNIVGNPEFQKRLTAPATSFLQDPRSITFKVTPEAPLELLRIVSAALNAPKTLPDLLSVNVTAND